MIIGAKETTVAYRCPSCGSYIMSLVGIFSLSGDLIKLKCSCSGSELNVTYTSDGKIRLTVPCIVCPHDHNYVISSNTFFGRELFKLSCAYTGVDVCFIGSKDAVMRAADESEKELMRLLEESGLDDFDRLKTEDTAGSGGLFGDAATLYDMSRFLLHELADEDKVVCRCKKGEAGDYELALVGDEEDSVRFICDKCGSSACYPAAELFFSDGSIRLESLYLI
ncbi:MAG: hypothetical protein ACYCWE_00780 [Eubacteriales bacterium]